MKKIILGLFTVGILFNGSIYAKNIVLKKTTTIIPLCERKSSALPSSNMMAFATLSKDTNKMKKAAAKIQQDGCLLMQVSQYKEIIVNIISDEKVKDGNSWASLKRIKVISIDGNKYGNEYWVADILNDIK